MRRRGVAVLACVALAACGADDAAERVVGSRAAIVKGVDSTASDDAVVLLMHYDALQSGASGCTGTMLTPRLLLTARHCVSDTDPSAACASDGTPISGGVVRANHVASKLYAFAGTKRPDFIGGLDKAARGAEILTDGAKTLCNHDVALVLLEKPLPGAKIAPIRLDGDPKKGEALRLVGWGVTDKADRPETRQARANVTVLGVGPNESAGPAEFSIGEGTCSGDSGGPALSEATGAVVGIASRGGNGGSETGAAACIGGDNVYGRPSGFRDLILSGYAKAGQEPWREGQPNPTLATFGQTCAEDAACQSSACNVGASVCSQDCSAAACPGGFSCGDVAGRRLCVATPPDEGGCAVAPRSVPPTWLVVLGLWLVVAGAGRRARR